MGYGGWLTKGCVPIPWPAARRPTGTWTSLSSDGVAPPRLPPPPRQALRETTLATAENGDTYPRPMPRLDLTVDAVTLTEHLVNIESVSHHEQEIADAVEEALRTLGHLEVSRHGHTVVARTDLGRGERVVIAGHLDTVPLNDNLPARLEDGILHGLGSCDMKSGDAVMLRLAADVPSPNRDLTFIFYEAEEVDSVHNGLRKLTESDPALLEADFAILMEPSNAAIEAGCQGTMRVDVRTTGERSHSARSWR